MYQKKEMDLTKIIRTSKDIVISGKKNVGKTIVLSWLGLLNYRYHNALVFSNYKLIFPHIYIRNIQDAEEIFNYPKKIPKIFLGDDFESWCFSRMSASEQNKMFVNDILLDWGKHNCSFACTIKREGAIDIGIRESASEFWELTQKLFVCSNTGNILQDKINNNILKQYLNFLCIGISRFDENLEDLPSFTLYGLQHLVKLYDTTERVKKMYIPTHKTGEVNNSYKALVLSTV